MTAVTAAARSSAGRTSTTTRRAALTLSTVLNSRSSTAAAQFSGNWSVDSASIAGLPIEGQRFAEIRDAGGLGVAYSLGHFDGILGLGFDSISIDGTPTPFKNLIDQKQVEKGMFAFFLGDEADGELTIGGYDEAHMQGDLTWVPLEKAGEN